MTNMWKIGDDKTTTALVIEKPDSGLFVMGTEDKIIRETATMDDVLSMYPGHATPISQEEYDEIFRQYFPAQGQGEVSNNPGTPDETTSGEPVLDGVETTDSPVISDAANDGTVAQAVA